MQVFGSTGSGGLTNTIKFVTGGSERVRIDASGNFGIGTTSPDSRLHVYSTSWEPTIRLTSTSGSVKTYGLVNNPYWATGSFHIYDFTTDNSRIHISSGGNIGIAVGSATPANRLDVVGDFRVRASGAAMILDTAATSDGRMEYKYNGTRKALIGVDSNNLQISVDSGNYLQFRTNSTERVRIADDGNVGIGTSSPAAKLHVNSSTMIVGDTATTQNVRQTIVGSTTGNASTTAKKIFVCGHTSTGTINVTAIITSVSTASATATFSFANAYGASATPNRLSYISLNSTITSIDCSYNNTGYQMEISVTYTGATAPTLYFTAEGMGSSTWTL